MSVTVPSPELPAEARSALVIATSVYADPQLARLRAPAHDAAELAAVLGDPRLGGFEVTALTDRSAHEIRMGVEDFLSDRRHDELLVLYLSCHGVRDKKGRLYFAAVDTRKTHLAATGIESSWLLERLDDCRARRQVLILDCCFSGAFAVTGAKGDTEEELQRHLVGHGRGRMVLTASRAGEYSFEGYALPGAGSAGSVFTSGLVDGLRTGGADGDNDGWISVEDAYDYAYSYVQDRSAAQTPQRWTYGAEGKIWLARNPAGRAITSAPPSESPCLGLHNIPVSTNPTEPAEARFTKANTSTAARLWFACASVTTTVLASGGIYLMITTSHAAILVVPVMACLGVAFGFQQLARAKPLSLVVDGVGLSLEQGEKSNCIPWEYIAYLGVLEQFTYQTGGGPGGVRYETASYLLVVRLQQQAPQQSTELLSRFTDLRQLGYLAICCLEDVDADPVWLRQAVERLGGPLYRSDRALLDLDPRLVKTRPSKPR